MGTPDLLGTYGTFSFYTSEPFAFGGRALSGGTLYPVTVESNVVRAALHGPDNPFRKVPEKVSADFTLFIDAERPVAKLVVGDEERVLAVGEWSDWLPVDFDLRVPLQSVRGMARVLSEAGEALRRDVRLADQFRSDVTGDAGFGAGRVRR